MNAPDPGWLPFVEVILDRVYGFVCLIILAILVGIIALGKVEEKTSYGLTGLVTIIGGLALVEKVGQKKSAKEDK